MSDALARVPDPKPASDQPRILRFGVFEVDFEAREIRKRGLRLKLQQKPFQFLEMLLERPGELVTRKQIAARLWPGVYVAFDRSLNTAVNALRRALSDSPRNPRFLETRQGLGYRFIAPVEIPANQTPADPIDSSDAIAVLPFQNISGDAALDQFADGVAERIIALLSSDPALKIIARGTAFRFKGRDIDAASAGREIHARRVVAGRVARRADFLNVSAELIDAKTGWRLWGEQYDTLAACPNAELDVAQGIGARLRLHLNRAASRSPKDNAAAEAYSDYLKGRYFAEKMTADALRTSVAYFEASLANDPNLALAHAGLADSYILFALLDIHPAASALARSRGYAQAALDLDPDLSVAHAALASVKKLADHDWAAAETEYQLAISLDGFNARARRGYSSLLATLGRHEEARAEIEAAREIDPLSLAINNHVAWSMFLARDYQGALEQAWRTLALEPRFAPAQFTLGLANEQLGNYEAAAVEFENAYKCSGQHSGALASLAHTHALSGETTVARNLLGDLTGSDSGRRPASPYWRAVIHVALGEPDIAMELLRDAVAQHDLWTIWLLVDPRLDRLRSRAPFAELLSAVGLEAAAAATAR